MCFEEGGSTESLCPSSKGLVLTQTSIKRAIPAAIVDLCLKGRVRVLRCSVLAFVGCVNVCVQCGRGSTLGSSRAVLFISFFEFPTLFVVGNLIAVLGWVSVKTGMRLDVLFVQPLSSCECQLFFLFESVLLSCPPW